MYLRKGSTITYYSAVYELEETLKQGVEHVIDHVNKSMVLLANQTTLGNYTVDVDYLANNVSEEINNGEFAIECVRTCVG